MLEVGLKLRYVLLQLLALDGVEHLVLRFGFHLLGLYVGQPPALAFLAHFEEVNVLGGLFVDVHNGLEFVLGGAFSGACD